MRPRRSSGPPRDNEPAPQPSQPGKKFDGGRLLAVRRRLQHQGGAPPGSQNPPGYASQSPRACSGWCRASSRYRQAIMPQQASRRSAVSDERDDERSGGRSRPGRWTSHVAMLTPRRGEAYVGWCSPGCVSAVWDLGTRLLPAGPPHLGPVAEKVGRAASPSATRLRARRARRIQSGRRRPAAAVRSLDRRVSFGYRAPPPMGSPPLEDAPGRRPAPRPPMRPSSCGRHHRPKNPYPFTVTVPNEPAAPPPAVRPRPVRRGAGRGHPPSRPAGERFRSRCVHSQRPHDRARPVRRPEKKKQYPAVACDPQRGSATGPISATREPGTALVLLPPGGVAANRAAGVLRAVSGQRATIAAGSRHTEAACLERALTRQGGIGDTRGARPVAIIAICCCVSCVLGDPAPARPVIARFRGLGSDQGHETQSASAAAPTMVCRPSARRGSCRRRMPACLVRTSRPGPDGRPGRRWEDSVRGCRPSTTRGSKNRVVININESFLADLALCPEPAPRADVEPQRRCRSSRLPRAPRPTDAGRPCPSRRGARVLPCPSRRGGSSYMIANRRCAGAAPS